MEGLCAGSPRDATGSRFPNRKRRGACCFVRDAPWDATQYDLRMTSAPIAPRISSTSSPERTARELAIRAASRWVRRYAISAAAFERAIERVEALDAVSSTPRERDSLTGLPIAVARNAESSSVTAPSVSRSHRVYYRLGTGVGSIDVNSTPSGDRIEAEARPFARRMFVMLASITVGIVSGLVARDHFVAPHPWFLTRPAASMLPIAGLVAGLFAAAFVGEWALGSRARRGVALAIPGASLLGTIAVASVIVRASLPSTMHIDAVWNSGSPDEATAEAEAYDAVHPGSASEADRLLLRAIPLDAPVEALVEHLHRRWRAASSRDELVRRLARAATARADEIVASRGPGYRLERLADMVAEWLPDQRREWLGRAAVLDARARCIELEPNAACLERAIDRARDGRVDEAELVRLQNEFIERARVWLRERLEVARAESDPFARSAALTRVESFARSIDATLHAETGIDLAQLREEIHATMSGPAE
jgi:hypothetical protein